MQEDYRKKNRIARTKWSASISEGRGTHESVGTHCSQRTLTLMGVFGLASQLLLIASIPLFVPGEALGDGGVGTSGEMGGVALAQLIGGGGL